MKRVLMFCSSSQNIYTFRIPLIYKFRNEGFDVYATAFDDDYADELKKENINFISINDSNRSVNPLKALKLKGKFYSIICDVHPDIVFTFMLKPNTFGVLAAKKAGIKNVYSMVEGAGDPFINNGIKWNIIKKIECYLYRKSFRYTKKVFFLNTDDIDEFVRLNLVKKEKTVRIYGIGVDFNKFKYENVNSESNTFVMIARMLETKGVYEYCKCAELVKKEFPEAEFLYLGAEGTIKASDIKYYIDNNYVTYIGSVKDVRPYLARSLVLILPSYREGMPMSIMEAETSGRGIITTDAVGCKDTVIDGYNGKIVPKAEYKSIAEICIKIINNKNIAVEYGLNARKYAEKNFDSRMINDIIFKEVTKN